MRGLDCLTIKARRSPLTRMLINPAPQEYLTIDEVATLLNLSKKTVRNKMASGLFKKGVHYFSPPGMGPRFKWSALVAWLEHEPAVPEREEDSIPMAAGYALGKPTKGRLT